MMRVLLSANLAGGSSEIVEIEDGSTVGDLLSRYGVGQAITPGLIRVNRKQARLTDILHSDDRVSMTPTGIAGAHSANHFVATRIAFRPEKGQRTKQVIAEYGRGGEDVVITLLNARRNSLQPEIQREMHEDLQRALDEHPFSLRDAE